MKKLKPIHDFELVKTQKQMVMDPIIQDSILSTTGISMQTQTERSANNPKLSELFHLNIRVNLFQ